MKHNLKPGILLLFLLSFLPVLSAFTVSAHAQEEAVFALDTPAEVIALAPDGQGGFYSLSYSGVDHFSWETKAFERIPSPETALLTLSWDGNCLWGMGDGGNAVYRLVENEWVPACQLRTESGERLSLYFGNPPNRFIASPDFFLFTYYDVYARQEMVCLVDSSIGKCQTIDREGFLPLCLYENQSILVMIEKDGQYGVFRFDLATRQAEPFALPNMPLRWLAAAYDQGTDTLYAVAEAGQMHVSHKKGEAVFVNNISGARGFAALSAAWVAFISDNRLYLCDTAKMQNTPILTILGNAPHDNAAFTAATGIRVVQADSHFSAMEHMSLAMTAKDSTVDIYCFSPHHGLDIVKRKGMFYDLRKSQVLSELSQELYPNIRKALEGPGGELVGWFTDFQVIFRADDGAGAILDEYGLKYPYTFEEMLDVTKTLDEMGVFDALNLKPNNIIRYTQEDFLAYFMELYIMQKQMTGERLHFDTPTFKRVVTKIMTEIPTVKTDEPMTDERNSLFLLEIISFVIEMGMQPPLQVDADTPSAIHSLGTISVINPASAHIEEALAYLEYAAKIKNEESYIWYKSMTEPMMGPQTAAAIAEMESELKALEEALLTADDPAGTRTRIEVLKSQITRLQSAGWIVSPEAVAHYHQMAERLYISQGMDITMDEGIKSFQARLLSGLIDIPEFIRLCEQRVLMIYAEQD